MPESLNEPDAYALVSGARGCFIGFSINDADKPAKPLAVDAERNSGPTLRGDVRKHVRQVSTGCGVFGFALASQWSSSARGDSLVRCLRTGGPRLAVAAGVASVLSGWATVAQRLGG